MRLIDAEPIEKYIENGLNCKDPKKRFGHDAIEIMTEIHFAPTITPPPNDPLTLEQIQEMADDIADDFISYVTGGVQNAAPYCANMRTECCERSGWCTGYSKECKGFFPKAYRRKPEEEQT